MTNSRILIIGDSYMNAETFRDAFEARGLDVDVATVDPQPATTDVSTIREFVGREMGVALIPSAVRPVDGITEVALDGPAHAREIALCSAVRRPGRVVEHLRDFIRENAANWSNED